MKVIIKRVPGLRTNIVTRKYVLLQITDAKSAFWQTDIAPDEWRSSREDFTFKDGTGARDTGDFNLSPLCNEIQCHIVRCKGRYKPRLGCRADWEGGGAVITRVSSARGTGRRVGGSRVSGMFYGRRNNT